MIDLEKKRKRSEYEAQWRAKNRDRVKAVSAAYYSEHRDAMVAYSAAYRLANPGKVDEYAKKYRAENTTKVKAAIAAWRSANPARVRHHRHKRRAMRKGADSGNCRSIVEWEKSWRSKSSVRCFWCEGLFEPKQCHTDHIIALTKGGPHRIDNLCISCASCNLRKKNKDLKTWNQEIASPVLL